MKFMQIINRNDADSVITSSDDMLNLKQRVFDLEAELASSRAKAKSKEDMLQKLLQEEDEKCQKLQAKFEISELERLKAESELEIAKEDQQSADNSIKEAQTSAHGLSKVAATDREWLEAEMSRRSSVANATKLKCEAELDKMKRRLTISW